MTDRPPDRQSDSPSPPEPSVWGGGAEVPAHPSAPPAYDRRHHPSRRAEDGEVRFLWLTWPRRMSLPAATLALGTLLGFAFTLGGQWFAYSAMSTTVTAHEGAISEHAAAIRAVTETQARLTDRVTTTESTLAQLQTAVTANQASLAAAMSDLSRQVGNLSGKIEVLLGTMGIRQP